jgi:hypothetical protein
MGYSFSLAENFYRAGVYCSALIDRMNYHYADRAYRKQGTRFLTGILNQRLTTRCIFLRGILREGHLIVRDEFDHHQ